MSFSKSKWYDKEDSRQAVWAKQREERGFDDTETTNLFHTIAQFVTPRLKVFRDKTMSFPGGMTFEEWQKTIDEIIVGFELVLSMDDWNFEDMEVAKKNHEQIQKSLNLFSKWFMDMWS